MLRHAWFIARKDVQYTVRERETILWLFIMPIMFFYFIGTITRGFGGGGDVKQQLAVYVPSNAGFLAEDLIKRLERNNYVVVRVNSKDEITTFARQLVIPEDFTSAALAGKHCIIRLTQKEAGLGQQYDTLRVGRATYTVVADLVACGAAGEEPSTTSFQRLAEMPRGWKLDVQSAGKRKVIPTGFSQAVPGTMVMFTMIILLTSGTVTLVIERRIGLLRRLASTPITRGEIVLGKWGGRLVLGSLQIAFAMIASTLLFKMDWGPNLAMVIVVLVGWAAFCASLSLLLANVVRSEGQAVGIGVISSNALAALGGCWWPSEITPTWMQSLAKCLPTGWAMDAMHKLINFQADAVSALPHAVGLFAGAFVLAWFAARRFQFQ